MILQRAFYQQNIIAVSKGLLGKVLVHKSAEGTVAGRIVETEAYSGPEDKAAHSYGGRHTDRNEVMYGQKGHAYIYFIYGMYYCINVTAGSVAGKPEAVLIRALEPVAGMDKLKRAVNLTNGPGRLCMAMGITKLQHKLDLTVPPLYIQDAPPITTADIVETTRIGVDYAGEWKNKPWRFYFRGNSFVSKK